MIRTLIIDDDIGSCRSLEMLCAKEGHRVQSAATGKAALSLIAQGEFELILVDLKLPDMSGLEVVSYARGHLPSCQIIVITGYATIETAVEAIKCGAYDYLTKPLSIEKVRLTCSRALEKLALTREIESLRKELHHSFGFENIIGKSRKMQELYKVIRQTAESDSNVLLSGESGTGKELVARAIHYHSPRAGGRFVGLNCGAISRELIESELFGYVRGAFTGALKDKTGFFEQAEGGTLFLDEIGETQPEFQIKLLRVLQEGECYKVGSPSALKVNVRIIAATNRNLRKAVQEGIFREDLFYRLNVISLSIPPLRERREDIALLAHHFLKKYAVKAEAKELTPEALDILIRCDFPGNIRELENAIESAVTLSRNNLVTPADLPPALMSQAARKAHPVPVRPIKEAVQEYERTLLESALRECKGNISQAARLLDVHRQSLQQKIKDFSIDVESLKEERR